MPPPSKVLLNLFIPPGKGCVDAEPASRCGYKAKIPSIAWWSKRRCDLFLGIGGGYPSVRATSSNSLSSQHSSPQPGTHDDAPALLEMLRSPSPSSWASPRGMFCWRNHPNLLKKPFSPVGVKSCLLIHRGLGHILKDAMTLLGHPSTHGTRPPSASIRNLGAIVSKTFARQELASNKGAPKPLELLFTGNFSSSHLLRGPVTHRKRSAWVLGTPARANREGELFPGYLTWQRARGSIT